ncbi:MAG: GNAT family N-acetyltransferase [Defluviitaleaceae bacterium]|nr:GNAT family N-acetyltransferase [Defluviitaleaceae bacterium]
MISIQSINEDNFIDVLELKASDMVAPNSESLAEAYLSLREAVDEDELPYAEIPFAILHDETVVGFAMVCFEDGEDVNAGCEIFWMSRLMIDEAHQGKGYGKAALKLLLDFAKTQPTGIEAKYAYTAYSPENEAAAKTYTSLGYEPTGQIFHGEVVVRLELSNA